MERGFVVLPHLPATWPAKPQCLSRRDAPRTVPRKGRGQDLTGMERRGWGIDAILIDGSGMLGDPRSFLESVHVDESSFFSCHVCGHACGS